jgi:hypothetical protein
LNHDASDGALLEQGKDARNPRTIAWDNAMETLDGRKRGSESRKVFGLPPFLRAHVPNKKAAGHRCPHPPASPTIQKLYHTSVTLARISYGYRVNERSFYLRELSGKK